MIPELVFTISGIPMTIKQLVGLRFASDDELPELLRRVLNENIQDPDVIKRLVQDWQGDYHRV